MSPHPDQLRGRRGLLVAVALTVVGGALTLLAAGRTWASVTLTATTGARVVARVTGREVSSAIPAIGVLLLVLTVALVASRGLLRRLVGLLVVATGAALMVVAVTSADDVAAAVRGEAFAVAAPHVDPGLSAWAVLAAVAGGLAVGAGALTVVAGRRWPGLGRRYEPPAAPGRPEPTEPDGSTAWESLDRGDDPTT